MNKLFPYGIDGVTTIAFLTFHIGAFGWAYQTFTWPGLVLCVVLAHYTSKWGVCMGMHRYFVHGGFKAKPALHKLLGVLFTLSFQGPIFKWAKDHRLHHQKSDEEGDLHSPHVPEPTLWQFCWAHIVWMIARQSKEYLESRETVKDLASDKFLCALNDYYLLWHRLFAGLLFGTGWIFGGLPLAWSFIVWGICVRVVYVYHITWFVNSAAHRYGYRRYNTTDNSQNCWWVAILSYGEGWHNNHHAYPRLAVHGHGKREYDPSYRTIKRLERRGWVWDVKDDLEGAKRRKPYALSPGKGNVFVDAPPVLSS